MLANGVFIKDYMQHDIMQYDVPEPGYGEVMIKTTACGLCCWDSWLYRGVNAPGPYPYVIGHEGVGVVYKLGDGVQNLKVGDKVFACTGGNEMMCEYFTAHESSFIKLPDDTTDWASVVIEPTSCVVNILDRANIRIGDHIVVVGAGYMGQLLLQGLTRASAAGKITVFELREDRRKQAEEYGVDAVYDPESEEGKQAIADIIAAGGADICVDFGASESGLALADSMTKKHGTLVIGSFHRGKITFDGTKWHLGGLNVYNISPPGTNHYEEIIPRTWELIKHGVFTPGKFVTHTAYYKDAEGMKTLFEKSIDKTDGYIKGVVLFDQD